ncbi:hypothetical protein ACHAXT_013364 [Thalassiosira profunda]
MDTGERDRRDHHDAGDEQGSHRGERPGERPGERDRRDQNDAGDEQGSQPGERPGERDRRDQNDAGDEQGSQPGERPGERDRRDQNDAGDEQGSLGTLEACSSGSNHAIQGSNYGPTGETVRNILARAQGWNARLEQLIAYKAEQGKAQDSNGEHLGTLNKLARKMRRDGEVPKSDVAAFAKRTGKDEETILCGMEKINGSRRKPGSIQYPAEGGPPQEGSDSKLLAIMGGF